MPNRGKRNNSKQVRGGHNRRPPATVGGNAALSKVIRNSTDIVERAGIAIKNRYTGPRGINNMAKDLSLLKMIVNTEDKHADQQLSDTVTQTSSLVLPMPAVSQGTTSVTRIGDSIKVVRFDGILEFVYSSGTTTSNMTQVFNWYLVRYKKTPSSSGYSAFNIAEFLDTDINSDFTPLSLPNSDTNENFQVMCNGSTNITLPVNTIAGTDLTDRRVVNFSHECNFHQEYNTSSYTGVCDNMCFLVVTALNPINTGGSSTCASSIRVWFVDN